MYKGMREEVTDEERNHCSKDIRWEGGKTGRWERARVYRGRDFNASSSHSIILVLLERVLRQEYRPHVSQGRRHSLNTAFSTNFLNVTDMNDDEEEVLKTVRLAHESLTANIRVQDIHGRSRKRHQIGAYRGA